MLLTIPLSLLVLAAVLAYSEYAENHLVSPQALILRAAHLRKLPPEVAERVIARESERLMRLLQDR